MYDAVTFASNSCLFTGSSSNNSVGVAVGVSFGGVIFIIIAAIICVFCCIACIAKSSSSTRNVRAPRPTRTLNAINYTTAQPTVAYPLQQLHSAAPQQPPTAYPTSQVDPKQPINPEFSSEIPPSYGHACNFPNYPPPAYTYLPVISNAGCLSADSNAGYPPTDSCTGFPSVGDPSPGGEQCPPQS